MLHKLKLHFKVAVNYFKNQSFVFFFLTCLSRNQGKQKHIFLNTTNRKSLQLKETGSSSSPSLHARRSAPPVLTQGRELQELPPQRSKEGHKAGGGDNSKGHIACRSLDSALVRASRATMSDFKGAGKYKPRATCPE